MKNLNLSIGILFSVVVIGAGCVAEPVSEPVSSGEPCQPLVRVCSFDDVLICRADGTTYDYLKTCEDGCWEGECLSGYSNPGPAVENPAEQPAPAPEGTGESGPAGGADKSTDKLWYPLDTTQYSEGTYANHPGNAVDITCPVGTTIYAAKTGKVVSVVNDCTDNTTPLHNTWSPYKNCGGGYGNNIVMEHYDGSGTRYAHLKKGSVKVSEGTHVCAGQPMALSGASGKVKSTVGGDGAHLHFEYRTPSGSYVYPPEHFADKSKYKGGKAFPDSCDALNLLASEDIISKNCQELKAHWECGVNRAAFAKLAGTAVGVDKTSVFGKCEWPCVDMNGTEWFYDWMVAMTLLVYDDETAPYAAGNQCLPGGELPRVFALKAGMEAFDLPVYGYGDEVPDSGDIPSDMKAYVYGAIDAGLVDVGEELRPFYPITYDWIAPVVVQALDVSDSIPVTDEDMLGCGGPGGECSPGETEQVDCGDCGVQSRSCGADGQWGSWGSCVAQGVCSPGETKNCSGNCGSGTQVCSNSCNWGQCSAPGSGECSTGQTETASCGDCGTKTRTCTSSCSWGSWGTCKNQGVCSPGESKNCSGACGSGTKTCTGSCSWGSCSAPGSGVCSPGQTETAACGDCGSKTRTCNSSCSWGSWGTCKNQGICSPGESKNCSGSCGSGTKTCTNSCTWGTCSAPGSGECSPGETDSKSCGDCGTKTRSCGSDCQWNSWGTCKDQGVCSPGETKSCSGSCGSGTKSCSNSCTWGSCDAPSCPTCYIVDNSDSDYHEGCGSGGDYFWTMSGSAVDDAEGGSCRYTYTNGSQQDCYAIWAFPDIPSGTYDIWVRIPDAANPPKPVAKAAIKYNIYYKGGTSKVTSYSVDQNYDQGTWKLIKQNQSITANSSGQYPVRVTLGDAWFQSMQYVLLLDAVKVCVSQ